MPDFTSSPDDTNRRPFYTFLGVCAVCLGIFLWLKLRLVSSVPKTAYAEPDPAPEQGQGGAVHLGAAAPHGHREDAGPGNAAGGSDPLRTGRRGTMPT